MVKYEQKRYSIRWTIDGDEVGGGYYTYDTLTEAQKGLAYILTEEELVAEDFEIYDNIENNIIEL